MARHLVENFLAEYTVACDDLNTDGVVKLLGAARVRFADREVSGQGEVRDVYAAAFSGAPMARHLISNLHVRVQNTSVVDGDSLIKVSCRYARWGLDGEPALAGLGNYEACFLLTNALQLLHFGVQRTWTRE